MASIDRRAFLQSTAAAAAAAALPQSLRAAAAAGERPNVLWVVTEDNTRTYDGPYGDPCARTPHVDRLASDGIVFENSHSNAPVCAPSRSTIITGRYASSLGTQHMRSLRPLPPGLKFFPEYLREAGYFCTNHVKTDYNTSSSWRRAWDLCNGSAHWRRRAPGQPFFAVFNFMESHESRLFVRKPLLTDPARVRVPPYLPDTPETRADLAQYYDCVGRADASLGKVLDELEADGLLEDTIVFYYADHGGSLPRSKRYLYDNGTHTPMVVRFPKKFRHLAPAAPGSRTAELVNYVDLAPTILSLAGLPAPAYFQGRAFAGPDRAPAPEMIHSFRGRMDERYDFSCAVTDGRFRYVRNYLHHRPAGQRIAYLWHEASMRRFDELHWEGKLSPLPRAFFEPRAPEELFDCPADPDNVDNLAGDPSHAAVLERFRDANRRHMIRIHDTGFLPEAMMIAEADGGSPAIVAEDPARYPVGRLLDFVDACQIGNAGPDAIAAAFGDPLPVVRYWAAVCALQRGDGPDCAPLLGDPDPSVRVAAAEAVLRRRADDGAWACLEEAVRPGQPPELCLASLNALAYLPPGPDLLKARVRAIAAEVKGETSQELLSEARTTVPSRAIAGAGWDVNCPHAAQYLVDRKLA